MSKSFNAKSLGKRGEASVGKWLEEKGFTVLEYNFSVREGEIDIIAQQGDIIAFVEVKTRKHCYFNTSEVITRSKQIKIMKAAAYYRACHNFVDKVFRFDVALVEYINEPLITYIPHAFSNTTN